MQLICLRSENTKDLVNWIKQKTGKCTSPESQNEMIQVMSNRVRKMFLEEFGMLPSTQS